MDTHISKRISDGLVTESSTARWIVGACALFLA